MSDDKEIEMNIRSWVDPKGGMPWFTAWIWVAGKVFYVPKTAGKTDDIELLTMLMLQDKGVVPRCNTTEDLTKVHGYIWNWGEWVCHGEEALYRGDEHDHLDFEVVSLYLDSKNRRAS